MVLLRMPTMSETSGRRNSRSRGTRGTTTAGRRRTSMIRFSIGFSLRGQKTRAAPPWRGLWVFDRWGKLCQIWHLSTPFKSAQESAKSEKHQNRARHLQRFGKVLKGVERRSGLSPCFIAHATLGGHLLVSSFETGSSPVSALKPLPFNTSRNLLERG